MRTKEGWSGGIILNKMKAPRLAFTWIFPEMGPATIPARRQNAQRWALKVCPVSVEDCYGLKPPIVWHTACLDITFLSTCINSCGRFVLCQFSSPSRTFSRIPIPESSGLAWAHETFYMRSSRHNWSNNHDFFMHRRLVQTMQHCWCWDICHSSAGPPA